MTSTGGCFRSHNQNQLSLLSRYFVCIDQSLKREAVWVIKSCSHKTHLLQIHARTLRLDLLKDPEVSLALLARSTADRSFQILTQIQKPDARHYNSLLRLYSLGSHPERALQFYRLMTSRGIRPDSFSISSFLKSCTRTRSLIPALQVHAAILKEGYTPDSLLMTTLIDAYSSSHLPRQAHLVFDEIPHPDSVSWNSLISCFVQNSRTRDALDLFDAMLEDRHGPNPDDVTCLLLLRASACLSALKFGSRIHAYMDSQGYGTALNLRNSLISMYSRCGCLENARLVFSKIPHKNVVSWSALISGLAMNGHGHEAIRVFQEMQEAGLSPDEQTFTGILSACSHGGFVDQGMSFFESMQREFGIVPNVHHYSCVVDLLGRAGLLDRAYNLVIEMPVKPDPTVWRTLLGACKIHGHVDLGERVIKHIIELDAQQAGDYVLLLNMYSSDGNWEKVAKVRRLMKKKGIQTLPGCSTIELGGKVHEFIVDDNLHPRIDEVYGMLKEINSQLKLGGYVADISSEMHNLCVEDKESSLSCHSEKLAISFGVLSSWPGTEIRVANNLRICVDCHSFAKVLSEVYVRVVVIRDRSRFHHFRNGHCSCNDYW